MERVKENEVKEELYWAINGIDINHILYKLICDIMIKRISMEIITHILISIFTKQWLKISNYTKNKMLIVSNQNFGTGTGMNILTRKNLAKFSNISRLMRGISPKTKFLNPWLYFVDYI